MKKLILLFSFFSVPIFAYGKIGKDCMYNGFFLAGRVRVVTFAEDFKIRIVSSNEDLKVEKTNGLRTFDCGVWQFYQAGSYNFKVRFVNSNEDFRIRFTTFSPGVP